MTIDPRLATPTHKNFERDFDAASAGAESATKISPLDRSGHSYYALQSQASASSKRRSVNFADRFKGKIQLMGKDGAHGIVKSATKPIEPIRKVNPSDPTQEMNSSAFKGRAS